MKYTKDQHAAIYERDKNLLISAGAGSGKTAVLTERVAQKISEGVDLDNLIILTFTDAAAKEMTIRIRKKLQTMHSDLALKALEKLDTANIKTFDSFALSIVKQYGYTKNLSQNVHIIDEITATIEQETIITDIFNAYYSQSDSRFLALLKTFETKNDQTIKTMMLDLYQALSLLPDFDQALSKYTEDYFKESHFNTVFDKYEAMVLTEIDGLNDQINDAYTLFNAIEASDYIDLLYTDLKPLLNAKNYQEAFDTSHHLTKLPSLGKARALKKVDEPMYNDLQTWKNSLSSSSGIITTLKSRLEKPKTQHKKDFFLMQNHIPLIKEILIKIRKQHLKNQRLSEAMDFASVASTAIQIVEDNETIRNELKQSINEIMIDEYQDTNRLQERFIELISNNNVYQVGDVKQSIYRFRHAEPDLFTQKYYTYQTKDFSKVIDLNSNFRSREAVLNAINTLFKPIMDKTIGGVDYDASQMLTYGNRAYDNHQDETLPYGLQLHLYDTEDVQHHLDDKTLNTKEMEFFHIAADIKKRVEQNQVITEDFNGLRPAAYHDAAILLHTSGDFLTAKKIFDLVGVPLTIRRGDNVLREYDIDVYRNLIKLTYAYTNKAYYNDHIKHSFLSVARSFLFDFNDDDIIKQALNLPDDLSDETAILDPFKPLFNKLKTLQKVAVTEPISVLWETITTTFDIPAHHILLKNIEQVTERYFLMGDIIDNLEKEGYLLSDLIEYLDKMIEFDLDKAVKPSQDIVKDHVQIMTIHQSKGLEFPFVYLGSLSKRFNMSNNKTYAFSKTYGILLPHDDEGLRKSFLFDLYKNEEYQETVSENLRVLYVALTRAKDNLTVMLEEDKQYMSHLDASSNVKLYDRLNYRSFNNIFTSVLGALSNTINRIRLSDAPLNENYRTLSNKSADITSKPNPKTYLTHPFKKELKTRKKYSHTTNTLLDSDTLAMIEKGNTMHHYFEQIDFFKPLDAQLEALNLDSDTTKHIKAFFNADFIQSLSIINVYKEFPFASQEDTLDTLGFIDLLLETEDAYIIIDYKLKNTDKDPYIDQIIGYANTIKSLTDKPVKGYLYSIIDHTFKPVL